MNGREKVPIEEFLESLPSVFNGSHTRNFRAKNYQAFEFGLDHLNDDQNYINTQLEKIEKQFDLVIITEHFWESIVLLSQLLCAPYEVCKIQNVHIVKIFLIYCDMKHFADFKEI